MSNNWNSRFWKDPPPGYNALADRHAQSYVKTLVKSPSKTKIRAGAPKNVARSKQISMNKRVLKELIDELDYVWQQFDFPEEAKTAFLDAIQSYPLSRKAAVLAKEIQRIKQNRAKISKAHHNITLREKIIDDLYLLDTGALDIIPEKLQEYRVLTLNVIESINEWKDFIRGLFPNQPDALYFFEGRSYIIKLKTDTDFLHRSPLYSIYEFAKEFDPFLVNPCIAYRRNAEVRQNKQDLPIPKPIFTRIQKADQSLDEEVYSRVQQRLGFKLMESEMQKRITGIKRAKTHLHGNQNKSFDVRRKRTSAKTSEISSPSNQFTTYSSFSSSLNASVQQIAKPKPKNIAPSFENEEFREAESVLDFTEPLEGPVIFTNDVIFTPIMEDETKAMNQAQKYLMRIQSKVRDAVTSIEEIRAQGVNGCWFWLYHNEEKVGLLIFLIDTASVDLKQIHVVHLSSIHINNYLACLEASIQYMFKQFPIDLIRTKLTHTTQPGTETLAVNPEVLQLYLNQNFKTIKLLNSPTSRVSVLSLTRPEGIMFENESNLNYFENTVDIKIAIVLQLLGYGHNDEQVDEDIRGIFTLAAILRHIEPEIKRTKHNLLTSFLFKLQWNFEIPSTQVKFSEKIEEVTNDFRGIELIGIRSTAKHFVSGFTDVEFRFQNFVSIGYMIQGITYAFSVIQSEIQVVKNDQQTIYLVPTNNSKYTCFFAEPIIHDKRIFENVRAEGTINEICVPCFDSYKIFNFKGLAGQSVGSHCIKKGDEGVRVQVKKIEPAAGMLRRSECQTIKDPFVFGVIYNDMDEEPFVCANITEFLRL